VLLRGAVREATETFKSPKGRRAVRDSRIATVRFSVQFRSVRLGLGSVLLGLRFGFGIGIGTGIGPAWTYSAAQSSRCQS